MNRFYIPLIFFGISIPFVPSGVPFVFSADNASNYQDNYQTKRNDYPDTYATFPLINIDLQNKPPKVSFLQYVKSGNLTKDQFDEKQVPQGKELEIRGYWISTNIIEAYQARHNKEPNTFFKGSDYPTYDEIIKVFSSQNNQELVKMIARLTELRRTPESAKEAQEASKALGPNTTKDIYHRIAFGTGMIEVEDPSATGADADKRRFIPLDLVKTGKIVIEPGCARIKILQSVVMTIVSKALISSELTKKTVEKEMNQTFAQLNCNTSRCATQGKQFATALEQILKIGLKEPEYDKDLDITESAKLTSIIEKLRYFCIP